MAERLGNEEEGKGYTHRVEVWVFPKEGEDQFFEHYFRGAPTSAQINDLLTNEEQAKPPSIVVVALGEPLEGA